VFRLVTSTEWVNNLLSCTSKTECLRTYSGMILFSLFWCGEFIPEVCPSILNTPCRNKHQQLKTYDFGCCVKDAKFYPFIKKSPLATLYKFLLMIKMPVAENRNCLNLTRSRPLTFHL
jgi:hypothetical protein